MRSSALGRTNAHAGLVGANKVHAVQHVQTGFAVECSGVRVHHDLAGPKIYDPAKGWVKSYYLVLSDVGGDINRPPMDAIGAFPVSQDQLPTTCADLGLQVLWRGNDPVPRKEVPWSETPWCWKEPASIREPDETKLKGPPDLSRQGPR